MKVISIQLTAFTAFFTIVAGCTAPVVRAPNAVSEHTLATELHDVIRKGDNTRLNRMLSAGTSPDTRDPRTGRPPLITALLANNTKAFLRLLHSRADPSLADRVGNTALHVAAQINQPELVMALLNAGGPAYARNAQGKTFETYLFMLPDSRLTPDIRECRKQVRQWLASHPEFLFPDTPSRLP